MSNENELVFSSEGPVKEIVRTQSLMLVNEFHPVLKMVAKPYDFSDSLERRQQFVDDMIYTMDSFHGLGLSAPQVASSVRLFVMKNNKAMQSDIASPNHFACFNPEVVESKDSDSLREGCLSFPGLSLQIKRPSMIRVKYQDVNGHLIETVLFGINARVFQHELDHLNGICFTDKVSKEMLHWEREKQRKLLKKVKKAYERNRRQSS